MTPNADIPHSAGSRSRVIAISSNKGGVGKTTVAANLAIYLRALREDLPVLLVSLDDQSTLDRMFALTRLGPGTENLKHGWARRELTEVIRLGQYGVHFVPSPPDTSLLKERAEDPRLLHRILERTEWNGVVILDTKSDLEALTRSAYHAADRIVVPVADRASLLEAAKTFRILEGSNLGAERARILFTLVDRRSRGAAPGTELLDLLETEVANRGWPRYRTFVSRSPRVESLISVDGRPRSILHTARGTAVYRQMHALTLEVIEELQLDALPLGDATPAREGAAESPAVEGSGSIDWKAALLRGVLRRLD